MSTELLPLTPSPAPVAALNLPSTQTSETRGRDHAPTASPTVGSAASAPVRAHELRVLPPNHKGAAISSAIARLALVQISCFGIGTAIAYAELNKGASPTDAHFRSQAGVALTKGFFSSLKSGHERKVAGHGMNFLVNLADGVLASGALVGATFLTSQILGKAVADMRAANPGMDPTQALQSVLIASGRLAITHGIVRSADFAHEVLTACLHAVSSGAQNKYHNPKELRNWIALASSTGMLGFLVDAAPRMGTAGFTLLGAKAVAGTSQETAAYALQSLTQSKYGIAHRAFEGIEKQGLTALLALAPALMPAMATTLSAVWNLCSSPPLRGRIVEEEASQSDASTSREMVPETASLSPLPDLESTPERQSETAAQQTPAAGQDEAADAARIALPASSRTSMEETQDIATPPSTATAIDKAH